MLTARKMLIEPDPVCTCLSFTSPKAIKPDPCWSWDGHCSRAGTDVEYEITASDVVFPTTCSMFGPPQCAAGLPATSSAQWPGELS